MLTWREPAPRSAFDRAGSQLRCSRHVSKESFYGAIGNNYQGEFRTAQESWVRAGHEVLSRIAFDHMSTEPFLRASAWLDACNQTGVLLTQSDGRPSSSVVAPELVGRPYFAAGIESYEVLTTGSMQTREMWGHHVPGCSSIYNSRLECVVQIIGATMATHNPGWLEAQVCSSFDLPQS